MTVQVALVVTVRTPSVLSPGAPFGAQEPDQYAWRLPHRIGAVPAASCAEHVPALPLEQANGAVLTEPLPTMLSAMVTIVCGWPRVMLYR